jgi:adenine-specific DNA-methyltransferase
MYRAHARTPPGPGAPSHRRPTSTLPDSPRWSPRVTLFDPDTFGTKTPIASPAGSAEPPEVLRPIQYLGNKQRSLGTILGVIDAMVPAGGRVADFFSGTSVVAQGIAHLGRQTLAVDVSPACAAIARATLGEGRGDAAGAEQLASMLNDQAAPVEDGLQNAWEPFLRAEDAALEANDGERLLELGGLVPQVWRKYPTPVSTRTVLSEWQEAASSGHECRSLLSAVFAGTYLGLRQTIALDARRWAVRSLSANGLISVWEEAALVTALLSAASVAAFSPGKHFAQPHRIDAEKDLTFHAGRVLSDRGVSVPAVVHQWIEVLHERGRPGEEQHMVLHRGVDDLGPNVLTAAEVRAVYADPPYTAQQYSRFYHALDTLALGVPKPLQVVSGRVTGGLYPEGRYLSPYCSKRQTRPAFMRLASLCRNAGASLVLSYSASSKESTGNARMIALPTLLDVLAAEFGRDAIEIVQFDHQYRQFNHRDAARASRADPEVLLIAHAA